MKRIIIVGSGLSGLSAAFYLSQKGHEVQIFERNEFIGGRTASWIQDGMRVESGLHRYLGFYEHMPKLLKDAGLDLDRVFFWEDEIEIKLPDKRSSVFAASIFKPIGLIRDLIGHNDFINPFEKLKLAQFFTIGFKNCLLRRSYMDSIDIKTFAKKNGLSDDLITKIVEPTSTGIYFLSPEKYSAYSYFALFLPHLPKLHKMRVGAFKGGMTDIMMIPLAEKINEQNGVITTSANVESLIYERDRIKGVMVNGSPRLADVVILASSLQTTQSLLRPFSHTRWVKELMQLQTMPVSTIQLELFKRSVRHKDRTTFAPGTCLASFAEQSQSTFTHTPGRLSIILTPPEKYINMPHQDILEDVLTDLEKIDIHIREHVKDFRVINHHNDFYSLETGYEHLRPKTKTPLKGLYLAGDYVKQRYLGTMEGAVYSGKLAAKAVN